MHKMKRTNMNTLVAGGLPKTVEAGLVSLVISVGKVEPGNVHAGIHQRGQALFGPARRADCANNFSTTTEVRSAEDVVVQFLLDVFEGDVPAGIIYIIVKRKNDA